MRGSKSEGDFRTGWASHQVDQVGNPRLVDSAAATPGGYSGGVGGGIAHVVTMLFDPATGAWSRAGDMLVMRSSHAATVLPGGEVLVAGGLYLSGGYPSLEYHLPLPTERFDPDTMTWSRTADLAGARDKATMTLLPDGTVLVTGGSVVGPNYSGVSVASAQRYVTPTKAGIPRKQVDGLHVHDSLFDPSGAIHVFGPSPP